MKTTLLVLSFLCFAGAAFGQASVGGVGISAEPVVYEFRSHAGHASQMELGRHQNIMEQSTNVQAHGVRPLWEVATPAYVVPLGDSARMLKKEHTVRQESRNRLEQLNDGSRRKISLRPKVPHLSRRPAAGGAFLLLVQAVVST